METKLCPTCGGVLDVDQFHKSKNTKDGLNWQCKRCHRERMQKVAKRLNEREFIEPPTGVKRCSTCKETKSVGAFCKDRSTPSGLCYECKACMNKASRERRNKHKVKNEATPKSTKTEKRCSGCKEVLPVAQFTVDRGRKDALKPICKLCSGKADRKWRSENVAKALLKSARYGAQTRGLEFSITLDDIAVPERCPVFGFEFTIGMKRSTSASIDRIDNTKGYIHGNVVVVSVKANHVKSDCSIDELRKLVSFYESLAGKLNQP